MDKIANNKDAMKSENRRNVLSIIGRQPVARIDIVRETCLARGTITEIIDELLGEDIIVEAGKNGQGSSLGRKPIMLDINPSWGYVIGLDIDHEGFGIGMLAVNGSVIGETCHLEHMGQPEKALGRAAEKISRLISDSGIDPALIAGLGVITPGPVDSENGIILHPAFFEAWHNISLRQELSRRLPFRIIIRHNAIAFTLAEQRANKGAYGNFALFAINRGIGSGLVLNHQAYSNARGLSSEMGHMSIDINGRLCECGNRGCLEMYASTKAVLYEAGRARDMTWREFVDTAHEGDGFCLDLLDLQAQYLAQSVVNLNNMLELDAVIITGMASYRGELLLTRIRRHMRGKISSGGKHGGPVIKNSDISGNIGVISAGTVVIDRLLNKGLFFEIAKCRKNKQSGRAVRDQNLKGVKGYGKNEQN